jgi:hypothetical protein
MRPFSTGSALDGTKVCPLTSLRALATVLSECLLEIKGPKAFMYFRNLALRAILLSCKFKTATTSLRADRTKGRIGQDLFGQI